jgi:hypothetical protein
MNYSDSKLHRAARHAFITSASLVVLRLIGGFSMPVRGRLGEHTKSISAETSAERNPKEKGGEEK